MTQQEADDLIALRKTPEGSQTIVFRPGNNQYLLVSDNGREKFFLDVYQGTIKLSKMRHQVRGKKVIVLTRLCIDGPPHTNPDGESIGRTHLHVYREGYEDKWAAPLDPAHFSDPNDLNALFADFCQFNHIEEMKKQDYLL